MSPGERIPPGVAPRMTPQGCVNRAQRISWNLVLRDLQSRRRSPSLPPATLPIHASYTSSKFQQIQSNLPVSRILQMLPPPTRALVRDLAGAPPVRLTLSVSLSVPVSVCLAQFICLSIHGSGPYMQAHHPKCPIQKTALLPRSRQGSIAASPQLSQLSRGIPSWQTRRTSAPNTPPTPQNAENPKVFGSESRSSELNGTAPGRFPPRAKMVF